MAIETRLTVLGHVVRGGAPSAHDRLMAGRLARAALWACMEGDSDVMVGWQRSALHPPPGDVSPHDPQCSLVPLAAVLTETRALLDGTSVVAKWRTRALSEIEELLHF